MKGFILEIVIGLVVFVGLNILSANFSFFVLLPFLSFILGVAISYIIRSTIKESIFSGAVAAFLGLFVLVFLMLINFFQVDKPDIILFIVFSAVFMVFGFGFGSIINARVKVKKMFKDIVIKKQIKINKK